MAFIACQLVNQRVRKIAAGAIESDCLVGFVFQVAHENKFFRFGLLLQRSIWNNGFNFTISGHSSNICQLSLYFETTLQCLEREVFRLGSLLFQALLKSFFLSLTQKTTTLSLKKSVRRFQTCTEILISILIREQIN